MYEIKLNDRQREAVETTEGFVRVIAGAGSGKTRALSGRFAYLVNEVGVLPGNILCVTFTNKSANEMKSRIRKMTGGNDTGYICTFHSFCVSVLQEEANAVQYPKSFIVLDNSDINAMLAIVYEERGLTLRHMTFAKARDMIEMKKLKYEPDYYLDMLAMPIADLKKKYDDATRPDDIIFYGYLYQEKKCFGLDYNDLLKFTLYIFEENAEIRQKWQERLEYIMIDEFQDIDAIQYELMKVLCGYHGNLFVVGDPDQTIYTWRGANVRYLTDFDKAFPGTKTIMMNENYRSTRSITAAANSLVSKNVNRIKKELVSMRDEGALPVYFHGKSAAEEAEWIAEKARELEKGGAKLSDMAVLYRAHYVTRTLEEVFIKKELPYRIYSGAQFFDRAEIKDALSYLRLIAFRDDLSFARIVNKPKRNIGERRMEHIKRYAENARCSYYDAMKASVGDELFRGTKAEEFIAMTEQFSQTYEGMAISELLSAVLDKSGYERLLRTEGSGERLDNLAELKQSIYEYETTCGEETTLESYLAHLALFSNQDADTGKNAVKLMTVHTAKGLEFPYVFLCAMDEGIFPSKKTDTFEGMEEERRLAFVAVTRAMDGLFLSDSEGRSADGAHLFPSRFVLDIERDLLVRVNEPDDDLVRMAKERIAESETMLAAFAGDLPFKVGDRIVHAVMGAGEIVGLDEDKGAYMIQFDILPTVRRISYKVKMEPESR